MGSRLRGSTGAICKKHGRRSLPDEPACGALTQLYGFNLRNANPVNCAPIPARERDSP
jgi:hypothetical protein